MDKQTCATVTEFNHQLSSLISEKFRSFGTRFVTLNTQKSRDGDSE